MARTLNASLIRKLKEGEYAKLLACIKKDKELSLEVRVKSVAMVYYKKSKILSLHSRKNEPVILDKGYWREDPKPIIDLNAPEKYFQNAKNLVNDFSKNNFEFDIQQKILADNGTNTNRYLVVDMEYQFAQDLIKDRTAKKTRFDLVAIDLNKNKVLLIELKQGFNALDGASGVDDHLSKYQEHIDHPDFKKALLGDIKNIVEIKDTLGIYDFDARSIADNVLEANIEFCYAFAFKTEEEKKRYEENYENGHTVFYIDNSGSNFRLK